MYYYALINKRSDIEPAFKAMIDKGFKYYHDYRKPEDYEELENIGRKPIIIFGELDFPNCTIYLDNLRDGFESFAQQFNTSAAYKKGKCLYNGKHDDSSLRME